MFKNFVDDKDVPAHIRMMGVLGELAHWSVKLKHLWEECKEDSALHEHERDEFTTSVAELDARIDKLVCLRDAWCQRIPYGENNDVTHRDDT